MRVKIFTDAGKIVNYVVQLEHLNEDYWKQVVRFNYYHGFVHKDFYNKKGEQTKKIYLGVFSDLKNAVELAITDIRQNYKKYIEIFRGD
jgi:hypothetical protein